MSSVLKEPSSAGPSSPRASSSASSTISVLDDGHWSKDDKYDADSYLDINYKKHLTRHANKYVAQVLINFDYPTIMFQSFVARSYAVLHQARNNW